MSRRSLLRTFALTAMPLPALCVAGQVGALPLLAEKGQDARELSYVSDVARLDRRAHPEYVPGQRCARCDLYRGGASSANGPCKMFSHHRVMSTGWCKGYETPISPR